jgi:hypothetical protein
VEAGERGDRTVLADRGGTDREPRRAARRRCDRGLEPLERGCQLGIDGFVGLRAGAEGGRGHAEAGRDAMAQPDQAVEGGALATKGIGAGSGFPEPLDQRGLDTRHCWAPGWTAGWRGIAEGGV